MNPLENQEIIQAQELVAKYRAEEKRSELAEALEKLASVLIREAQPIVAANALEEAADIWLLLQSAQRFGSCLLLAAANRRLAADLRGAKRVLELGMAFDIPAQLKRGFTLEFLELKLDNGEHEEAYQGFTNFIAHEADHLSPPEMAFVYQRLAAAANLSGKFLEAGQAFLKASEILNLEGHLSDAEDCAMAASTVLMETDLESAERIYTEVCRTVPQDGKAAIKRGMLGSKLAQKSGDLKLAIKRIALAKQGALDIVDPLSYLAAAVEASHLLEQLKEFETAYTTLATAWVTIADLVGKEEAAKLVRPELEAFRDRMGAEKFLAIKQAYEEKRRESQSRNR